MRISVRLRRRWRISSCPAAKGIRCVNPSSATESPSCTNSAAASRNDTRVATISPRSLPGSDARLARCPGEFMQAALFLSRPIIEIACAYRTIRVSFAVSRPFRRRASMPRASTHKSSKSAKPTRRPDRAAPPATVAVAAAANSAASPPTPSTQIDALTGDPDFMTSLARGLAVIQAFSQKKRQLTISQVSNKTGFSRAAVRRCLYTLAKLGFAGSDDNRHFFLQPRVLALGHSYTSSMPLATAAHPILERFSRMMHESCSIATLDGLDIVYVARANVTRIMAIDLGVGSRLPAFGKFACCSRICRRTNSNLALRASNSRATPNAPSSLPIDCAPCCAWFFATDTPSWIKNSNWASARWPFRFSALAARLLRPSTSARTRSASPTKRCSTISCRNCAPRRRSFACCCADHHNDDHEDERCAEHHEPKANQDMKDYSKRYENTLVAILFFSWGTVFLDRMSQLYLAPYIAPEFHLTHEQVGMLASVLAITWAVSTLLFGALSDRFGRRRILIPAVFAFSLLSWLSGVAHTFHQLLLIRALMGIAEGPCWSIMTALIEESSTPSRRGRNIGIVVSAGALVGLAVAPILTTQVAARFGWRWAFFVCGVPGILMGLLMWKFVKEPPKKSGADGERLHQPRIRDYCTILRYRNVWLCCIGAAGFISWLFLTNVFAPLYITEVAHQKATTAGFLLGATGLGSFILGFLLPALSDRLGRKPVLLAMAAMSAFVPLVLLIQPLYAYPWILAAILFLTNAGQGMPTLTMVLIPTESVPPQFAATSIGLATLVGEVFGATIAPTLGGALAEKHGLGITLLMSAGGAGLLFLVALFLKETANVSNGRARPQPVAESLHSRA